MADYRESRNLHWLCIKACAAIILFIAFYHTVLQNMFLSTPEKRELLISTEIPVEYIDPTSIDLTALVNTLINSTQSGSQHLFSLLSVTSHSSLSLQKFNLLVYNISNFRNFETNLFPRRFCYCVSNRTNDLTDFTAILLDVIGNSTSYLQEIFKSSSILSVDQHNNSECIYICVMAGKTDRDLSQLWEMESIKPLFNQTITADIHKGNMSVPGTPSVSATTSTAILRTTTRMETQSPLREQSGCPQKRSEPRRVGGEYTSVISSPGNTTVSALRLQPCLLELCQFFSQCLCRPYTKARARRQAGHHGSPDIASLHTPAYKFV